MMGDNNMQIDEEDGDEGEDGGDWNSKEGNDKEDEGSRFFNETKVRDSFQEDLGSYEEKASENVKENHGKGNTNNNVVASPSIEGPKKICSFKEYEKGKKLNLCDENLDNESRLVMEEDLGQKLRLEIENRAIGLCGFHSAGP
ncbi:hypothetical protein Tco_1116235 [Tanacetum coccineum]